jgi:hypothetical protein
VAGTLGDPRLSVLMSRASTITAAAASPSTYLMSALPGARSTKPSSRRNASYLAGKRSRLTARLKAKSAPVDHKRSHGPHFPASANKRAARLRQTSALNTGGASGYLLSDNWGRSVREPPDELKQISFITRRYLLPGQRIDREVFGRHIFS